MSQEKKFLKELLAEKGVTPIEIARAAGVRRSTVYLVIHNRGASMRIMRLIAKRLKMSVDEIIAYLPPKAA